MERIKKLIPIFMACMVIVPHNMQGKIFLVFGGKTGWIGQKVVKLLKESGHTPVCAESRLENREALEREIDAIKPDFIINAAGKTGRPNVDWCESHKQETIRVNVLGSLNLVDVAFMRGIPVTLFTTGCIYSYDAEHPMRSGKGFAEEEEPNFRGSFYSATKILIEKLVLHYPNVLNLRIKMPVSADMNPRSFIGKILSFERVVNIPNSLSVLEDLLPIAIRMTERGLRGNYNLVNPGPLSHHEILELYKQCVDPQFVYSGFSEQEQEKMSKNRSNCELSAEKLLRDFPDIPNSRTSIIALFKQLKVDEK